jgi:hypothetical protein
MTTTTFRIPAAVQAALSALEADAVRAVARHQASADALARMQAAAAERRSAVSALRSQAEGAAHHLASRIAEDIMNGGTGDVPAVADAATAVDVGRAEAALAAAEKALPQFEAAEAADRQAVAGIQARKIAVIREAERALARHLAAQLVEHLREVEQLRLLLGSTCYAAELTAEGGFAHVLDQAQIDLLNDPEPRVARISVADMFAGRRHAVADVNTPLSSATDGLIPYLNFWRAHRAALESVADTHTNTAASEAA